MKSRTAVFTATLLAASAPTAALARPTIVVDEAIPFSADDLADAVSIRADSNAQIHVNRQGDVLVITVGNQARTLSVDPAIDPHDLARVVALVIVGLDAPASAGAPAPLAPVPPAPPAPPVPPAPPPPLPTTGDPALPIPVDAPPGATAPSNVLFGFAGQLPPPKNWTLRLQAGYERTEWTDSRPVMATLSRRLGPSAHLVVGIGYDTTSVWNGVDYGHINVSSIPMRAGVELRHRWFAIEGGIAGTYWDDPCLGGTIANGGYVAARAYLFPLGSIQNRVFAEAGMRHVTSTTCMGADLTTYENRDTTMQASLGLELPL
jgi:hypothetical protein